MTDEQAQAKSQELWGESGIVWKDEPPDLRPLYKVGVAEGVLREIRGYGWTWEEAFDKAAKSPVQ